MHAGLATNTLSRERPAQRRGGLTLLELLLTLAMIAVVVVFFWPVRRGAREANAKNQLVPSVSCIRRPWLSARSLVTTMMRPSGSWASFETDGVLNSSSCLLS